MSESEPEPEPSPNLKPRAIPKPIRTPKRTIKPKPILTPKRTIKPKPVRAPKPIMTDKVCKYHPELIPDLILNEPGSAQYGQWRCPLPECGRWITHARKPKTDAETLSRQNRIRQMLRDNPSVTEDDQQLHKLLLLYNKPYLNLVDGEFLRKRL